MGIDPEHVDVDGQVVVIGDDEVALSGRNVDGAVVLELEEHRELRGGLVREVEAHGGPDPLRLARRLQVHVENEVRALVQPPGHAGRLRYRGRPRLPEQEVAVGLEAVRLQLHVHAREADAGIARVAPARGAGGVDEHIGVVDDLLVSRPQLQGPHIVHALAGNGKDEVAEYVAAFGRERVRLAHLDDQVWRAELPAFGEAGRGRRLGGRTFGRAFADPALEERDLILAEAPLPRQVAVAALGRPRRHVTARGHARDLVRALAHVRVAEEAERTRLSGTVTRRAVAVHDRGDVAVERYRLGRR